jgi:plasmid stabilization system protein ParE
MMRVVRTSQAELDFAGIVERMIDEDALNTSQSFIDSVAQTLDLLGRYPEIGSISDEQKARRVRSFQVSHFPSFVVYYVVRSDHVLILRILHASQDIESAFNPRS